MKRKLKNYMGEQVSIKGFVKKISCRKGGQTNRKTMLLVNVSINNVHGNVGCGHMWIDLPVDHSIKSNRFFSGNGFVSSYSRKDRSLDYKVVLQ